MPSAPPARSFPSFDKEKKPVLDAINQLVNQTVKKSFGVSIIKPTSKRKYLRINHKPTIQPKLFGARWITAGCHFPP